MRTKALDIFLNIFIALAALLFLVPIILTFSDSFMTSSEISANYGVMFNNMSGNEKTFVSENANLKFIPDEVTVSQYRSVLITNSDYLLKFWNSVILTVPITFFQIIVALLASYGFSRYPSRIKGIIFFAYTLNLAAFFRNAVIKELRVQKVTRYGDVPLVHSKTTILPSVLCVCHHISSIWRADINQWPKEP